MKEKEREELKKIRKQITNLINDSAESGTWFKKDALHLLYKSLEQKSIYKVEVSYSETNPEHFAILFTGFDTGGYWELYSNSYDEIIPIAKVYKMRVVEYLGKLD